MNAKSKLLFTAMLGIMATTYGVASVAEQFSVTPSLEQELHDAISEEISFLQKINVVPVDQLKGEKVMGGVSGLLGKRTNTNTTDRATTEILTLGSKVYELSFTEYDVHLRYSQIDSWAKFPDFQARYGKWVRKAIGQSRIRTGFHGTSIGAVTDGATNTMGEDVNKGWLQHLREYDSGKQWFDEGANAGEIRVGAGGDFENLDSLVFAVKQMINPLYREGGDLVAIVGSDLIAEEKAALYKALGQKPTEKERIEKDVVTRVYGGCPIVADVPFFPPRGVLVTSLDNLSIYFQSDSWRRQVIDNPKRSRVEDFNSVNDGYVIEDEEKAAGIEFANVLIPDGAEGWE